MKLYKLLFSISMMTGTIMAISAYSWFSMWMGLEINLLSIIPLMVSQKSVYPAESSMKYFITQAMASLVLLMAIMMMLISNEFITPQVNSHFSMMLNSALLTKLGAAPFHYWFPEVMEGLNWVNCMILLTWQKIAPMILIMNNKINQHFLITIILTSLVVSTIMAFNQISLRKILAFSSINHIAWMLSATMVSFQIWTLYFMIYSVTTALLTLVFKAWNSFYMKQLQQTMNKNKTHKMMFMMTFLSMGGLPPFIGFMPKWLVINWMTNNSMFYLSFMLITMTLVMLFVYIRISSSSMIFSLNEPKIKTKIKNNSLNMTMNFTLITLLISCTLLLT